MKKFFDEFKAFALQGNVMNLAVGIIIGAAFQEIVTSLTNNILSPLIGLLTRQNFDSLQIEVLGTTLQYGAFITAIINFLIMAFVVFILIRGMNKLFFRSEETTDEIPTEKSCPFCFTKIHVDATRCPACTSHLDEP